MSRIETDLSDISRCHRDTARLLIVFCYIVLHCFEVQQRIDHCCIHCIVEFIHFLLIFRSPFCDDHSYHQINKHCGKDDDAKPVAKKKSEVTSRSISPLFPDIECADEIDDGNENIGDRWKDIEENVFEKRTDGICASIDNAKDFAGLERQTPTQRPIMQIREDAKFHRVSGVLLDFRSQRRTIDTQET